MSYASRSRRRQGVSPAIWPGFVDVLSTLLLVMIFLLVVYMLAQYFLQRSVSEKSEALSELDHQVAELADLLREQIGLQLDIPAKGITGDIIHSPAAHKRLSEDTSLG